VPYRIFQFDNVLLPEILPEDDLGTGAIPSSIIQVAGGSFDWAAGRRLLPSRRTISYRGKYTGNNNAILRGQVDAFRALLGREAQLSRRRDDDLQIQWITARLLQISQTRRIDNANVIAEIEALFESRMAAWRTSAGSVVSGSRTGAGEIPITINNIGNVPIEDGILTVSSSQNALAVTVYSSTGIGIFWQGTMGAGMTLAIDSGKRTVTVNGTEAYNGFTLVNHSAENWLSIPVGMQSIVITVTASASVSFYYYNQFV
jgi:hypothetical protein